MTALQKRIALTDARIDAAIDFREGAAAILQDAGAPRSVPGLRIRIGARSATWYYSIDKIEHGHRTVRLEKLGQYDRGVPSGDTQIRAPWHMGTDDARKAATVKAAAYVQNTVADPSLVFADAFAEYLDRLQAKADNSGKAARWRENVRNIGAKHLLPRWGQFPLAEMSDKRETVGRWYNQLAREVPSTAAHCRQIIRAVYNWKRKAGAKLPADNPALMPIDRLPAYRTKAGRKALPRVRLEQFPAWLAEWRKLPSAMQRAYWLFLLFTGQRPGEALRLEWASVDYKHNTATIPDAKADNDITFPLSEQIRRVLDLAREASGDAKSPFVFHGPNAEHWSHRDAPLEVPGHGMRRTFKTVSASLGFPNEMTGRLLGHQPEGVSADYEDALEVQRAAFLADIQTKVSAAIVQLLGSDPTRERVAPLPPSARDVARARGAETYKSDQVCPAGHRGERYVSTNRCCQCVADKNYRQKANRVGWRKANREHVNAGKRQRRARHGR